MLFFLLATPGREANGVRKLDNESVRLMKKDQGPFRMNVIGALSMYNPTENTSYHVQNHC